MIQPSSGLEKENLGESMEPLIVKEPLWIQHNKTLGKSTWCLPIVKVYFVQHSVSWSGVRFLIM